ncbi:MAG TPA: T9SS type A sorting domain-containing protein, partial [Bacteroidia bacterium]|nr:T9SS type A sorting domain-containing protein [Bacteroidia bacterium]
TVVVTNSSGCSATSAPFSMLNTGIVQKVGGMIVMAFPNPAAAVLNLNFRIDQDTPAELSVMDLLGNVVLNSSVYLTVSTAKTSLDVSTLSPGIYILKVSTSSGQGLIKFFKQ